MSSAEEGRANSSPDNGDKGSVDAEEVNLHEESQNNQDATQDVVGSSPVPPPDPPARSPTERLREKMAWDAGTGISPPLPSTISGTSIDEEVERTNATDGETQMDLEAAASAPPLVRTPSMRLRQKLMSGGSYEEVGRSSNISDGTGVQPRSSQVESSTGGTATAEVEYMDRKRSPSSTTGLDDDDAAVPNSATYRASVESLPTTEPILTRPVATNTSTGTSSSSNAMPDKRAAYESDLHDTVTESVERVVLPVDTQATRHNRRIVRPGAYAVPGIGSTDSTSRTSRGTSTSHSDVYAETPRNDIIENANSPADALAAYCVEEEGVVATGVVVESELEGSKDDVRSLWAKYRYCIIAGVALVLILVILGATGVFSGNDNGGTSASTSTPTKADEVPEATFKEVAYKIGSFPGAKFGVSLAMQGRRLAVGTHESTGTVSVAVYDLNGPQAVQVGQIIPGVKGDVQGRLSKDGRRLVVGEEKSDGRFGVDDDIGQTRVFELNETSNLWQLVGQTIYGDRVQSRAGKDVSISSNGDVIATGMPFHGSVSGGGDLGGGAVRAFKFSGGGWTRLGSGIFGVNEKERLGWSVALSDEGTTLVVGSRWNRTTDESSQIVTMKVGSLSVYTFNEDVKDWVQLGQPIFGVAFDDIFGARVAVNSDGSIIAGGAYHNDDAATDSGHVRVYQYSQDLGAWEQMGSTITGILARDNVAPLALSADGKRIAIGAPDFDSNRGYAKVYDYVGNDWVRVGGGVIKGRERGSVMGFDIALSQDGYRLAVGSRTHLGGLGIVRVFELPERLK
mmetsp:Transcript_39565/g.81296  ORF Transcript_39565/g.81296 Transcript_39565/m.81296 type:complete len:795 (+) Transcript_39565:259-2643(+)